MSTPTTPTPASSVNGGTSAIDLAVQQHATEAVVVQGFALSALEQPHVDFRGFAKLTPYQDNINQGVDRAKDSANFYLNICLPKAITTIANIDAYFQLQNALPQVLAPNTSPQDAMSMLKAMQDQVTDYRGQAGNVTKDLQGLRGRLSTNAADLAGYVTQLNAAVDGDKGVLKSVNDELGSIDGKIGGCIAGIVLGGLAIIGGALMIAVGAIGEFFTGGASTALIVGGVGVLAAGVGVEVGASVTLAKLFDLKGELLSKKANLQAETKLATGISSGLHLLAGSAVNAAEASQRMANAWNLLGEDLGSLITDLQKGQTTVDALRRLFATAAEGAVKTVQNDVVTIKGQLSGVKTVVKAGKKIGDVINSEVTKLRAA